MPKNKVRRYTPKAFESTRSAPTSANIFSDMLTSEAYKRLSLGARATYTAMKDTYYNTPKKKRPNAENLELFYFPVALWRDKYAITTSAASFQKYTAELINNGFIDCVENGANTRTKTIYKFSSRWNDYGTPYYKPPALAQMTAAMLNKLNT